MKHLLTFIVEGDAVGKGRPRVTRNGTHTPERTKVYAQAVRRAAERQMEQTYPEPKPFDCPMHVDIQVRVAVPVSWSQANRGAALSGQIMPTGKPDKDNVEKAILDACNAVVWKDDSYICAGTFIKVYADTPCVIVTVRELSARVSQNS